MIRHYFTIFYLLSSFLFYRNIYGQNSIEIQTREIILNAFEKGHKLMDISSYPGTLLLHGMSEFGLLEGNEDILKQCVETIEKFGTGEIKATGNFFSYEAGGSGAAYLSWKGATDKLDDQVYVPAEKMMSQQKRTPDNLMTAKTMSHHMFIDVVFAVTPYLLYSGLKFNNPEYVDYAVFQTLESFRILKDKKTGLLHQGRGFQGEGKISEDNWSRGNGWGAFALAILVRDLPESHPRRKEVVQLAKQFFSSVLKFQNSQGLWHQEMTDTSSYVETSGSGILLYGLGIMIEKGIIPKRNTKKLLKGLEGYLDYIGHDGSVSHTCMGCLCPGKGTKEDYKNRKWIFNDYHAFGPVVLAFTQAAKMGIDKITPSNKLGYYIHKNANLKQTFVTHARGSDVAWENDRIAFRVFGPEVRGKVKSGIDVWGKKVEYPVLEKWYKLNEEGYDYHTDRGEGCDFYNMGNRSGCGAVAIWLDGKPYLAETYHTYKIIENNIDKIRFELQYNTWNIPGVNISEEKTIEMVPGTNLFMVSSTFKSDTNKEITIAIGLSGFGNPEILKDSKRGVLSLLEQVEPGHGNLGTAVLADPKAVTGFASFNNDEFVLLKVKTNAAFTYYAGAGWDKSIHFNKKNNWEKYILSEANKAKF
jgi:rhamnogalacturonyl hydrolase YesR